jgi:hypothetical protein
MMPLVLLLASSTAKLAYTSSDDRDKDQSGELIRLVERAQDFTIQDFGTAGPSLGDRIIFTSDLFDEAGNKVGSDGADCVVVRIDPGAPLSEQQVVQCTVTVELADGQITFQGLARGTENLFAVTGGTGAYRAARGEAYVRDRIPLQVADVTIRLFR